MGCHFRAGPSPGTVIAREGGCGHAPCRFVGSLMVEVLPARRPVGTGSFGCLVPVLPLKERTSACGVKTKREATETPEGVALGEPAFARGFEPGDGGDGRWAVVGRELRAHIPFTALGTLTGGAVLGLLVLLEASRELSVTLFWFFHPLHVVLSALVTTAMFRRHGGSGCWTTLGIGFFGSVGIATFSDCLLPYVGEWLLELPNRGLHLGFVEKWWLVNPLALGGIAVGVAWPHTGFPHAGHVLLSTWASLFHITMAMGVGLGPGAAVLIAVFLFFSVWLPCCTSDIVFPLLFTRTRRAKEIRPVRALP